MKRVFPLLALFSVVVLEGCMGDCETERCSSGRTYQSCVEGKALVIRDDQGVEFSRCVPDYGPGNASGVYVGTDKNDCALKHSVARDEICERYASGTGGGGGGPTGGGPTGGGPSGGGAGSSHCYKANDNSYCDCSNRDEPPIFGSHTRVNTCAASVGLVGPACCITRDTTGKVTSCNCTSSPRACREDGSVCSCPLANSTGNVPQIRSSCQPTGARICCISNSYCKCGTEQYPGAGCIAFGGLNEDATQVSSCTAPAVAIDWCNGEEKTNCDGLVWAP